MLSLYFEKLFEERGIKNKWICEKIGITPSYLSNKFSRNSFDLNDVMNISKVLNVSLEEIRKEFFKEKEVYELLSSIYDEGELKFLCKNCNTITNQRTCENNCTSNSFETLGCTNEEVYRALSEYFGDMDYKLQISENNECINVIV